MLVACRRSFLLGPVTWMARRVYRMTALSKPNTQSSIKLDLEGSRILDWLPMEASFSFNYLSHFQMTQSSSCDQHSGAAPLVSTLMASQ